jgi:hypothetical protein
VSLGRLFRDRYRLWRRRLRVFMLGHFVWYKRRYARRRIAEITPRNTRLTVDIEEDLFLLGMPIVPTLEATLDDPEAPEVAKLAVLHVLSGLGELPCLAVLERTARDAASAAVRQRAEKFLRVASRRLARRGELPEQFRIYADDTADDSPSESS